MPESVPNVFCFAFFFLYHMGKDYSYIVEGLGPSKSDHPLIPLSSPTVHIATEPLQKSGMCQDWIGMFHLSLPTFVICFAVPDDCDVCDFQLWRANINIENNKK